MFTDPSGEKLPDCFGSDEYLKYNVSFNASSGNAPRLQNITVETKGGNPRGCGSLLQGDSCPLNFTVNATGSTPSSYELDVNFSSVFGGLLSVDTSNVEVCIGSCPSGDGSFSASASQQVGVTPSDGSTSGFDDSGDSSIGSTLTGLATGAFKLAAGSNTGTNFLSGASSAFSDAVQQVLGSAFDQVLEIGFEDSAAEQSSASSQTSGEFAGERSATETASVSAGSSDTSGRNENTTQGVSQSSGPTGQAGFSSSTSQQLQSTSTPTEEASLLESASEVLQPTTTAGSLISVTRGFTQTLTAVGTTSANLSASETAGQNLVLEESAGTSASFESGNLQLVLVEPRNSSTTSKVFEAFQVQELAATASTAPSVIYAEAASEDPVALGTVQGSLAASEDALQDLGVSTANGSALDSDQKLSEVVTSDSGASAGSSFTDPAGQVLVVSSDQGSTSQVQLLPTESVKLVSEQSNGAGFTLGNSQELTTSSSAAPSLSTLLGSRQQLSTSAATSDSAAFQEDPSQSLGSASNVRSLADFVSGTSQQFSYRSDASATLAELIELGVSQAIASSGTAGVKAGFDDEEAVNLQLGSSGTGSYAVESSSSEVLALAAGTASSLDASESPSQSAELVPVATVEAGFSEESSESVKLLSLNESKLSASSGFTQQALVSSDPRESLGAAENASALVLVESSGEGGFQPELGADSGSVLTSSAAETLSFTDTSSASPGAGGTTSAAVSFLELASQSAGVETSIFDTLEEIIEAGATQELSASSGAATEAVYGEEASAGSTLGSTLSGSFDTSVSASGRLDLVDLASGAFGATSGFSQLIDQGSTPGNSLAVEESSSETIIVIQESDGSLSASETGLEDLEAITNAETNASFPVNELQEILTLEKSNGSFNSLERLNQSSKLSSSTSDTLQFVEAASAEPSATRVVDPRLSVFEAALQSVQVPDLVSWTLAEVFEAGVSQQVTATSSLEAAADYDQGTGSLLVVGSSGSPSYVTGASASARPELRDLFSESFGAEKGRSQNLVLSSNFGENLSSSETQVQTVSANPVVIGNISAEESGLAEVLVDSGASEDAAFAEGANQSYLVLSSNGESFEPGESAAAGSSLISSTGSTTLFESGNSQSVAAATKVLESVAFTTEVRQEVSLSNLVSAAVAEVFEDSASQSVGASSGTTAGAGFAENASETSNIIQETGESLEFSQAVQLAASVAPRSSSASSVFASLAQALSISSGELSSFRAESNAGQSFDTAGGASVSSSYLVVPAESITTGKTLTGSFDTAATASSTTGVSTETSGTVAEIIRAAVSQSISTGSTGSGAASFGSGASNILTLTAEALTSAIFDSGPSQQISFEGRESSNPVFRLSEVQSADVKSSAADQLLLYRSASGEVSVVSANTVLRDLNASSELVVSSRSGPSSNISFADGESSSTLLLTGRSTEANFRSGAESQLGQDSAVESATSFVGRAVQEVAFSESLWGFPGELFEVAVSQQLSAQGTTSGSRTEPSREEEDGSEGGDGGGGGGGSTGGSIVTGPGTGGQAENDTEPYRVQMVQEQVTIRLFPGNSTNFPLNLKNEGETTFNYSLRYSERLEVRQREGVIPRGESTKIEGNASLERGAATDNKTVYSEFIEVVRTGESLEVRLIERSEAGKEAEVQLEEVTEPGPEEPGELSLEIFNIGTSERLEVNVSSRVTNSSGSRVFESQELVNVRTSARVSEQLPELKPGQYTAEIQVEHPAGSERITRRFSVPEPETGSAVGTLAKAALLLGILLVAYRVAKAGLYHRCEQCGRIFRTRTQLQVHRGAGHLSEVVEEQKKEIERKIDEISEDMEERRAEDRARVRENDRG